MKQRDLNDIVNTKPEIKVTIPEHQRFLAFRHDRDAVAFDDWWFETGGPSFRNFINERENNATND